MRRILAILCGCALLGQTCEPGSPGAPGWLDLFQQGSSGQTGATEAPQPEGINAAPAGEPAPELGAHITIRIRSESRVPATVLVRYLIAGLEVRRTELQVPPGAVMPDIGPDLASTVAISGTYPDGSPLRWGPQTQTNAGPSLVLVLGYDYVEGDTREYVVLDPNDNCPGDPDKREPGQCGCGTPDIDSDGDGTADCIDLCPLDPNKTAPGVCGCGVSDVDSDGDGLPDCLDGCPTDPLKIAPGPCGCGVPDTDSDNDGVPDCIDLCPNTPPGMIVDVNGCSVRVPPDFNADGDVDQDDLNHLSACMTGPGIPQTVTSCLDTDLDQDGDTDQDDFGIFQRCYSGKGNPAHPNCAN